MSETAGDYDGQFLFINDKANARMAVIDLRDFETKQIVKTPNAINDHGGAFVTPNTEYVIEGPQYAAPIGYGYAPLDQYKDKYRGLITFWEFDRAKGRIDPAKSFQIELPPYWQDLCDAGKKVSEGWVFCNSFNTEMATGGVEKGNPPFEAGATKNDTDYLHIINWKKAEEIFKAGKAEQINGMAVIKLQTAIDEGILYFAPEPKSPHGVDVTPGGEYIVVGGKLDPHVTVYSFDKIQSAIAGRRPGQGRVRRAGHPDSTRSWKRRSSSALARCTPCSTTRAMPTPRCSSTRPWRAGRWAAVCRQALRPALEAGAEAAGALQHRPHRRRRGRHGLARTASTWWR